MKRLFVKRNYVTTDCYMFLFIESFYGTNEFLFPAR